LPRDAALKTGRGDSMASTTRQRAVSRRPERDGARSGSRAPAAARTPAAPINGAERPAGETRARTRGGETIEQCIVRALDQYFADLGGAKPHPLHEMVMQAVERPLLRFAMERCAGNQSLAAELLGMNRNTLRKKLQEHSL
jgi:Fis family transcriptional regulator